MELIKSQIMGKRDIAERKVRMEYRPIARSLKLLGEPMALFILPSHYVMIILSSFIPWFEDIQL